MSKTPVVRLLPSPLGRSCPNGMAAVEGGLRAVRCGASKVPEWGAGWGVVTEGGLLGRAPCRARSGGRVTNPGRTRGTKSASIGSARHAPTSTPAWSIDESPCALLPCERAAMGLVQGTGQAEGAAVGRGGDISL